MEIEKIEFIDLPQVNGEKVRMIKPEGMTEEQALEFAKTIDEYARNLYKKIGEDLAKYGEVEIKVTKLERTAKVAGNSSDDV